jgi:hypothetical protein
VRDIAERLAERSILDPETGCILWTGTAAGRYGQIRWNGEQWPTHRVVYTLARGPIPPGMFICHRCDTPLCIREEHLFLGTPSENTRDSVTKLRHANARKTHCSQGHRYDEANTWHGPGGSRACRACNREKARRLRSLSH